MPLTAEILIGFSAASVLPLALCLWTYSPRQGIPGRILRLFCWMIAGMVLALVATVVSSWWLGLACLATFAGTAFMQCISVSKTNARRWIIAVSCVATGVVVAAWAEIVLTLQGHFDRFPMVSLSARLSHEQPERTEQNQVVSRGVMGRHWLMTKERANQFRSSAWPDKDTAIPLTSQETAIETAEYDPSSRIHFASFGSLLATHRSMTFQFRNAAGFGPQRWREMSFRDWKLELPDRPLIAFTTDRDTPMNAAATQDPSRASVDYDSWHTENLLNFAEPRTLGFVQWDYDAKRPNLDRVLGFVPHGFGSRPEPPRISTSPDVPWRIDSLQLVSLLKNRPGAVYLSDHLPNMTELSGVPTRPLDTFETEAIARIIGGEELVVAGDNNHLRMVGSVRAMYQCLECHQVPRGTLLGAFTYSLSKDVDEGDSE